MKHFIRVETTLGLAPVRPERLPTRVKIVHQGSGQEVVMPLAWNGAGRNALTTWNIPPAAKLGVYEVVLEREAKPARPARPTARSAAASGSWTSGNFRVEEFRLPLVDARVSGPKAPQVAASAVAVDVQMSYFSGGAMASAPLRASALLSTRSPGFAGYDEFSFEPARDLKQAQEGTESEERDRDGSGREGRLIADKVALTTDRNGVATLALKDLPKTTRPAQIDAEVTFNDPNGETQTASTRIELWPSALVLGVKAGSWASNRGRASFSVVALDTQGKPIKGQSVAVRGRVSQVITTRKRLVGGFYDYDNRTEVKDLGPLCSGSTDDRGLLACEASLDSAGQVELIAQGADAQGHRRRGGGERLDHEAGRALVRAGQRRSHRRPAREEALRAGRDGAAAGAHAVPRGDRAGRRRARGRDRDPGRDAARRRSDRRAEDPADLGAERLRQRPRAARPDPRDAVVLVLHLGLEGAALVVAELPPRQGLPRRRRR